MFERFRLFLRGVSTSWPGTLGVALTTSAFLLFVFVELLRIAGIVTNAYVGLITYMALPALFVLGLILIPVGWHRFKRASGLDADSLLTRRFPEELTRRRRWGSNLLGVVALLTVVNILFLGVGGARMLHFMDEPEFCGTACHQVMNPEWVTYQDSPHAHVRCVDCHVGEGAEALVDAKLNGLWQIISATFRLYEKPIPTPVHNLRPARETCEKCHWPDKVYGDRIKTIETFALDEASTPSYTTLALKVGAGRGEAQGTIHWHIAPENEVRYQATDETRSEMAWVEVRRGDAFHRYTNRRLSAEASETPEVRTMDCVDCHNRATHIYQDPEDAVDEALSDGRLDRGLPFAKRTALGALLPRYADADAARAGIANAVRGRYRREAPRALTEKPGAVEDMIETLRAIHARNVHPGMNIHWNTYPSHLGHEGRAGCMRCHSADLVDGAGHSIPYDCTLCHSMLAYDSPEPFRFLQIPDEKDPDRRMHTYLREEFVGDGGLN
jgi:hypothetical protein